VADLVSKRKIAGIITIIAIVLVASVGAAALIQYIQGSNLNEIPPKFCTSDFVNLDKISQISVFRSFEGHDYSDDYEHNLSMKHYFTAYSTVDSVEIYSPTKGTITQISQEQNGVGYQVQITPAGYSEYRIIIFHLNVTSGLAVGDAVEAGQQIGTTANITSESLDIAVMRPGLFTKNFSYFDAMTDDVFAHYHARGVTDRSEMIRSAQEAKEMSSTYSFSNPPANDWVILNSP
jgi:hypothetical protein